MLDYLEVLEWDSKFFGFTVARIDKNGLDFENREALFNQLLKKNVKLGYYFSPVPLSPNISLKSYDILLVDKKVPLEKPLEHRDINPNVYSYKENYVEEELVKLAQQAGIHTRFNRDPNIPRNKYEELFKIWIEKSVSKELATDVLVYKEKNKILGFATIQLQEKGPYVSLLAVQKEHEGKGISFALMNAIENILINRGHTHVYGATQMENRKAMVVYQRFGLKPQPEEYVYHLWKK